MASTTKTPKSNNAGRPKTQAQDDWLFSSCYDQLTDVTLKTYVSRNFSRCCPLPANIVNSMKSFIKVLPDSHFPIQNIPFGIFSTNVNVMVYSLKKMIVKRYASKVTPRPGVAIGDMILDLQGIASHGLLDGVKNLVDPKTVFSEVSLFWSSRYHRGLMDDYPQPTLNKFMSFKRPVWTATRERIQELLSSENSELRDDEKLRKLVFVDQSDAIMHLPAHIG